MRGREKEGEKGRERRGAVTVGMNVCGGSRDHARNAWTGRLLEEKVGKDTARSSAARRGAAAAPHLHSDEEEKEIN